MERRGELTVEEIKFRLRSHGEDCINLAETLGKGDQSLNEEEKRLVRISIVPSILHQVQMELGMFVTTGMIDIDLQYYQDILKW